MSDEMVEITIRVPKKVVDSVPDGYDAGPGKIELRKAVQGDMVYWDGKWRKRTVPHRTVCVYLVAPRKQRTAADVVAGIAEGKAFVSTLVYGSVRWVRGPRQWCISENGFARGSSCFAGTESDIKILSEGE